MEKSLGRTHDFTSLGRKFACHFFKVVISFSEMEDCIRVAIFTDTHLGHKVDKDIRGGDSFAAFDECLQIARRDADAVLHAGDLFDNRSPSCHTLIRSIDILGAFVIGTPTSITISREEGLSRTCNTSRGNIALPFFVIHGNHDQPAGDGHSSPCEVLASAGLVNCFQTVVVGDSNAIVLSPVVLERGSVKACVYGLGAISENAFIKVLEQGTLSFVPCDAQCRILLVHQNRKCRDGRQLDIESMLAEKCPGIDVIVWGHEHENRVKIKKVRDIDITQPGSTVAVQLAELESGPRAMEILEILPGSRRYQPILLDSPRPFVYEKMTIDGSPDELRAKIKNKLDSMITKAGAERPLIHLKVISNEVDIGDIAHIRSYHEFDDRVANPDSFISVKACRPKVVTPKEGEWNPGDGPPISITECLLKKIEGRPPSILASPVFNSALCSSVESNHHDAFKEGLGKLLDIRIRYLCSRLTNTDELSMEDAEAFIERERGGLPETEFEGQETEVEPKPKASRNRKARGDEDLSPEEAPRPKRRQPSRKAKDSVPPN
jgi:DNA repair exonuclease SbcCD nuclease subunit